MCVLHVGRPSSEPQRAFWVQRRRSRSCIQLRGSPERFLVLAYPLGSSSASSLRLRILFSAEGERFLCASLSSEEDSGRLTLQSPNSFDSSPMQQFIWLFFLIKLSGSVSLEMETVPLSGATCDVNLSLLR